MIITIFGKKGSGKTSLSKTYASQIGGRVIFLSPVENLRTQDFEIWDIPELINVIPVMRPGQISVVRRADVQTLDILSCLLIINTGYTLIVDEIERYSGSVEFIDLIHYSRHVNVNIIANTRRYTGMPRLLTSQSDILNIFGTNEPGDLDYIRKFIGENISNNLRSLGRHEYLYYAPENQYTIVKKTNIKTPL